MRETMVEAAKIMGATIKEVSSFTPFIPYGISGVVVIAESHLSIHTWPEYNYAAVDFFTCGDHIDPWKAFNYLKRRLKAKKCVVKEVKRGKINEEYLFKLTAQQKKKILII